MSVAIPSPTTPAILHVLRTGFSSQLQTNSTPYAKQTSRIHVSRSYTRIPREILTPQPQEAPLSRSRIHREHRRARRAAVRAIVWPKLTQPLLDAWVFARNTFIDIADIIITPRDLAEREYIRRAEHRRYADLIRHLELLARRIILAAALALNFLVRPLAPAIPRQRKRGLRLFWLNRPETWRARFSVWRKPPAPSVWSYPRRTGAPPVVVASFPLARRFEAVRRALVNPDAYIRRLAIRIARFDQRNRISNNPVAPAVRPWTLARANRVPTQGARWIRIGMEIVEPMVQSQFERWNQATEPG